eukprot:3691403-Alexandrium_andersonii.AAC.1
MAMRSWPTIAAGGACTAFASATQFGGRTFLSLGSATPRAWRASSSASTRPMFRGFLGVSLGSSSPSVLHLGAASRSRDPV